MDPRDMYIPDELVWEKTYDVAENEPTEENEEKGLTPAE
jgi:hypothetical protein